MNRLIKMSAITACAATMFGLAGCGEGESAKSNATPESSPKLAAPVKENKVNLPVGNVNINMEEVRAAIRTWQKDRWNADLIARSKEANGKVCAADFKVKAKYKDLQPTFDLLADDYAFYVNVLDSFADASSAGEAVSKLMNAMSFDDMIKMAKDIGNAVDGAKSIKDKAGWKDALPICKDLVTISAISASMTNASGILQSIFDQVMKK